MKQWMVCGAACAALMGVCVPATAATSPELPARPAIATPAADDSIESFYATRQGAPLWLRAGAVDASARALLAALRRSPLDGFSAGPALATQAEALIARAAAGDRDALGRADRLLSTAWVLYVRALQTPPPGMTYADRWVAPRQDSASATLARAASARSLQAHVAAVSSVNPVYAQLRDAAWNELQMTGSQSDARVLATLARARMAPFQQRYVMVDAAAARLYMVESGRIVDSMKVIVGKPSAQTPMLASTIYYATLNPYWNVPGDLIQSIIAPRVLDQGVAYLKTHGYEVLSGFGEEASEIDPSNIDWRAVAEGRETVRVRQRPGPGNSMGRMKFGFPNASDIYLHDTPRKELFAESSRSLSNGCIRLEDAERLGRWLIGREPTTASPAPEQHVALPTPVPIFVTYLTAQADGGRLSFVADPYGKDSQAGTQLAALR